MKKKGLLLVICGPSGVGKGTVCNELIKYLPNLKLSVSATTREKRQGEIEGKNYYFIKKDKFKEMIHHSEFLEYAEVYDNLYGTPKNYVLQQLNEGNDILLEIDIQGAMQIKNTYPEGTFIFILPPSMGELRNRIFGRATDSNDDINKRLKCAYDEIDYIRKFDYYVVNDDIEKAVEKFRSIILAEKCRVDNDVIELITEYKEEFQC